MSLPEKKGRESSQLPTLSYEIKLTLPANVDSNPQEISFLDLITNDSKFKNDKESLETVLSSYVKACGKESVKEILAERDTIVDGNGSLADVIRALMDFNDQQNANLGVGYDDPENDDSFIDDSRAAQDIIPKNMTNERDGFYVNEKHQPIKVRYLSEPSGTDSEEEEDDSDDDDDESSESEKEEKQNKKTNINEDDLNEKAKKSKADDDMNPKLPNIKRKRSISEAGAPPLTNNLDDKNKNTKPIEESVKKVKKLSETTGEQCAQNLVPYVLPNEIENDIKPCIEKLAELILFDQIMINNIPKKIERLFDPIICHELLDMVKKLHRHTNANRQLVFDILSSKTGLCTLFLITRARLLLLNDYEPSMTLISLNELKEKLKIEISRSLEIHIQAHNQAIKEWQQRLVENPSKDKNRGPRKNFRLYKTINELIIRCIDRRLESMTMLDADSLELFLHDHIVPLWEKPGWMTAKKIINEVIRIEYRPLRDTNLSQNQLVQATRVIPSPSTAEQMKKESQIVPPPVPPKVSKPPQQQTSVRNVDPKTNDMKSSTNNSNGKQLEMATRVTTNPTKQHTSRPTASTEIITTNQLSEQSSNKTIKSDVIRPIAKPAIASPSSQADSSSKRMSTSNSSSVIDLTMDLFSQYKKQSNESSTPTSRANNYSSSNKDLSSSSSQRPTVSPTASTNNSKQQQQFATKMPSEKMSTGSFLKEALLTGSSSTPSPRTSSPKMTASPLAVDNMLNKSINSPKTNTNTSTIKPTTTLQSPTNPNQRSSGSHKNSTHRPSTDLTHHRTDQQIQQQKTSSSSNRPQSNTMSPSSSASLSSRRPTSSGHTPGFTSHEQQSNRGLSSQIQIPPSLSQTIQWDSTTLQLAAAALANPQLFNSSVIDPHLFNSVFGNPTNMVPSTQLSSSSSHQHHSQNTSNNRRT